MIVKHYQNVEKRERLGLTSHFLLDQGVLAGDPLGVTWVTVEAGAKQLLHHHTNPQVYVIIAGQGMMQVGDEKQAVSAGNLIAIPSDALHGIENNGEEMLVYVSAATPAFDLQDGYDKGQLQLAAYQEAANPKL